MKAHEEQNSEAGIEEREAAVRTEDANLLPLDLEERIVALKVKETGAIRRHIFKPIAAADVNAYFASLTITSERKPGDSVEHRIDVVTGSLKLYERAIKRVEGYSLVGGGDLMSLGNWKERVPGGHQISAVAWLMRVEKSSGGADLGIDPAAEVVSLDASWTQGERGMLQYRGLLHRFSPPTLAHWRELNSAATRSTVVGGSRSQKTVYPKLNAIHLKLYDELVLSADGYSIGGRAISGREECISRMDAFHKIAASTVLFERSGSADEAEETEEA